MQSNQKIPSGYARRNFKEFIESKKITIAILFILLNFAIGLVSKFPILQLITHPKSFFESPLYFVSAIIAYIFSWVLAIIGIYLLGKETYDAIRKRMRDKVRETYHEHLGRHVENVGRHVQDVSRNMERSVKKPVENIVKAVKKRRERYKERYKEKITFSSKK